MMKKRAPFVTTPSLVPLRHAFVSLAMTTNYIALRSRMNQLRMRAVCA